MKSYSSTIPVKDAVEPDSVKGFGRVTFGNDLQLVWYVGTSSKPTMLTHSLTYLHKNLTKL